MSAVPRSRTASQGLGPQAPTLTWGVFVGGRVASNADSEVNTHVSVGVQDRVVGYQPRR